MIDTHNHLDFAEFDADRAEVVARARAAGVVSWVIAGSDHEGWDRTVRVAAETGGKAILGVHPWSASTMSAAELEPYLRQLRTRTLSGIGEIGLDALHADGPSQRERQRQAFRDQLAIARERDLPVAIHCVRAYPELVVLLERDGVPARGGAVHAWSGPAELVERIVRVGLHVGFAAMVTHDRARKARESVPRVPAERILLETDCPGMKPPGAARGEPIHLLDVAKTVAELRGERFDEVWERNGANARAVWGS